MRQKHGDAMIFIYFHPTLYPSLVSKSPLEFLFYADSVIATLLFCEQEI